MSEQLRVTQIKSKIGGTRVQRETLRSLGLRRIGDVVVKADRPEEIAARRGLPIEHVAPAAMLRARAAAATAGTAAGGGAAPENS